MSNVLTGNLQIELVGSPTKTLATLDELKEYMSGGDVEGVTKEYVDTQLATKASTASVAGKADKTYVDNALAKKFDIPTGVPEDGAMLTYRNGAWVIENPQGV